MDSGEEKRPTSPVQLPGDLIYRDILPRLPFRLLARFATVCKEWRDVILRSAHFASVQAQSPSPASAALARFENGRFEVLTPGAASIAPPDPDFSFLTVDASQRLELCACASGLLCLTAPNDVGSTFFVVNPATREFHTIPYAGEEHHLRAGLAYDPETALREGYQYHLVVVAAQGLEKYRFWRFSSREGEWRESREELRLPPFEKLHPKPAYVGGRVHWLSHRGDVVWYNAADDLAGKLAPPGEHFEGNRGLVAWRGRLGLACASVSGLGVWALAGGGASPARWEMVHWRIWDEIPGVERPFCCFLWSVVPAGLEAGGEEALGLAVRTARMATVEGESQQVWHHAVVRYDLRTGVTVAVVELDGNEVHDDLGSVFGYHSSMAALPALNLAASYEQG